jgi:uncharacterized protein YciI
MPYFVARLVAHRPDFPAGLTPEEAAVMQRHAAFLAEELARGTLVIAGPVLDANGVYGLGVFEAPSLDDARALIARDPAQSIGRYEISAMANAVARPPSRG